MNNRRGRPALRNGETSTSVNVRLPDSDYDRIFREARARRCSVPDILRRSAALNQQAGVLERLSALETRVADEITSEEMAASFAACLRKALEAAV